MKFFATLAAGLITAATLTPIPAANAQRVVVERHHSESRYDRHHSYGDRRHSRYKTVCRTRWSHGDRVRRCYQVRR